MIVKSWINFSQHIYQTKNWSVLAEALRDVIVSLQVQIGFPRIFQTGYRDSYNIDKQRAFY